MTKSFVPLPEIPFIFVKVSAKCTVKPLAPLVASFTTRILTPLVIVVVVVSTFAPPLMVNSVPRSRCTELVVSSPLKFIPAVVNAVFAAPTVVSV